MTSFDRRLQPRIEWTADALAMLGEHRVRLRARDLSVGGVGVDAPWSIRSGEPVSIELEIDGAALELWAEIAWTAHAEQGCSWGLRFVELADEQRDHIEAFVDRCLAVDILQELYVGARTDDASTMSFAAEPDELPTRIYARASATADDPAFFPSSAEASGIADATAEIDVEVTLTEAPLAQGNTVRVAIADVFPNALPAEPAAALELAHAGPQPIGFADVAPEPSWEGPPAVFVIESVAAFDAGEPAALPEQVVAAIAAEHGHVEATIATPSEAPGPMTPDELRELKQRRIAELLASVPRRADAPEPEPAAKRPRARLRPDDELRSLYQEALRFVADDE